MEINKFTNFIKDPLLYYKLDPGEPGLATPSVASQSIARVAAHEAGNLRSFQKEADENGGVIVYSYLFLDLKYVGSFLAATSGKSEALIVYPAEKTKKMMKDNPEQTPDDLNKNLIKSIDKDFSKSENKTNELDNNSEKTASVNFTDDKITEIDTELKKLQDEKLQLQKTPDNNFDDKNESDKIKYKEIEKRIQILEQEKQNEKLKEFLTSLGKTYGTTMKLIALNVSSMAKNTGNFIDTLV